MSAEKKLHRWQSARAFYARTQLDVPLDFLKEHGLVDLKVEPDYVTSFFWHSPVRLKKGVTAAKARVLAALLHASRPEEPMILKLEDVRFIFNELDKAKVPQC